MAEVPYFKTTIQSFSIRYIQDGQIVYIPVEQQMLLYQLLDIAANAELDIEGEVVIL